MNFRGTIQNGKVILSNPAVLPDGTEVRVTPTGPGQGARPRRPARPTRGKTSRSAKRGRTLLDTLKPFIGSLRGLPRDASANVDHYLYGAPKRS